MQGVLSLVLVCSIGITYASIAGNDDFHSIDEKPDYYPKPETFGKPQDPAYRQYQVPAFGRPQPFAFNRPQAQPYNQFQAPQPQAPAYAQPEAPAYNRFQASQYDTAAQQKYYNYVQLQQQRKREEQLKAYYKEIEKEKAEAPPAPSVPLTKPPPPAPRTFCPGRCPKWCLPKCNVECCNPKPPPMPEYLQRQQLTATACEGHKLKIKCPNRSDRIIMYSSFYGREKDGNTTCHHDVLPSKGTCNDQEHHVNEKVYNLCGHEHRCEVAVNNKFLANDNTTICPGVYKYLKVIYKCSQHPKIFKICPLPCKTPENCFPSCAKDCCSPTPKPVEKSTPKAIIPAQPAQPPQPSQSCPAPCPASCQSPCTAACCYQNMQRDEIDAMFGIKPHPHPQPANMYASQSMNPQPSYYTDPYASYQPQQNPFTSYKQYDLRSKCPAACTQACSVDCPPECCGSQRAVQSGRRVVNYYG